MNEKWDLRFLNLAKEIATWSKDPSTKVGCVIANEKFIVSLGFNGFPKNMNDDKVLYYDRETKYSRTIHAELNAILNTKQSLIGLTIYCTLFPCSNCALHIIQSGIKRLVSPKIDLEKDSLWIDSFNKSKSFLDEAEVDITLI